MATSSFVCFFRYLFFYFFFLIKEPYEYLRTSAFFAAPETKFEKRYHRITESQHGWGWKGPLWVTQPNPLTKQGHPEQAAQDLVQEGLEYLQRRRLHNLPGQPVPGLRHPQREEVKVIKGSEENQYENGIERSWYYLTIQVPRNRLTKTTWLLH